MRVGGNNGRIGVGVTMVSVVVLVAVVGPLVLPYDATKVFSADRFTPPITRASSGGMAWLGTDELGRDLLAQVMQGARVSLGVGLSTVLLAGFVGVLLGVIAGFAGGWVDSAVSRAVELQLAIPPFLLAILIAAVLGPSIPNLVIALAVTRWVKFTRVARGAAMGVREEQFVDAASVMGARGHHVVWRHVLPNVLTPLVVIATVEFGFVILAEAGLSFLGLGTPLSTPSWGLTISTGRTYIDQAWWLSVVPGLALVWLGIGVGLVGDGLRDGLDPRGRLRIGP